MNFSRCHATVRTELAARVIVPSMAGEDPPTQELKLRELTQERAEREQVADAESEVDALRHRRRAAKASYLRRKLEEREESEREASDADEPPPAA
jgi:hypothetical protein